MAELRGYQFKRVLDYANKRCDETPGVDRDKVIYHHLKAWAIARTLRTKERDVDKASRAHAELIREGGELVGVRLHVG